MLLADHPCRLQALGRPGRRHPDIDDGEVRNRVTDGGEQPGGVGGPADDIHARALEQAGEPFTQQDVVVGQDHPQPVTAHPSPSEGRARTVLMASIIDYMPACDAEDAHGPRGAAVRPSSPLMRRPLARGLFRPVPAQPAANGGT
jgi:hypothetical protein